jgi:Na+:H+ antiporter, NhaA family
MSLFIGGLAFDDLGADFQMKLKLGVLAGSLIAGIAGSAILLTSGRRLSAAWKPGRSTS